MIVFSSLALAVEVDKDFPTPPSFLKRVEFWKKIYTEVDGNEGLIHDTEDFFIYGKIKIEHESLRKKNKMITSNAKDKISNLLLGMGRKEVSQYSPEEKELFERLGSPKPEELHLRAEQVRFQKGQKDKFYQGIVRSQLYMDYIKREFKEAGLPERLAYLPHVESSFNYQAYSKVGAAGIWQFMRSTGRIFMRVNYLVDERRDPIISTRGAIKLLKSNYNRLGAWPLAITAYNHGPESIARAISKLNTRDIEVIIDDYNGKKFKFASKNFYACFLAASEVAMAPNKYFKEILSQKPLEFTEVPLKESIKINDLLRKIKISEKTFKDYNLSLRPVVYKKNSPIPSGFVIKIPSVDKPAISALEEMICASNKKPISVPDILSSAAPTPKYVNTPAPIVVAITTPAPTIVTATTTLASESEEEIKIKTKYDFSLKLLRKEIYQAIVQQSESLTLYADWLDIPLSQIAKLNDIKTNSELDLGKKILLPIKKKQISEFKEKREQYFISIEEDFFENYRITKMKSYQVKKGDTLTEIADRFDIPVWIILQIQKEELKSIRPKQIIQLPEIQPRKEKEAPIIPGNILEEQDIPENYNPM